MHGEAETPGKVCTKMTGAELIKWIEDNHAEDMLMVIQYRDSGGAYEGCEDVCPIFAKVSGTGIANVYSYSIDYNVEKPNAVSL